MNRMKRAALAVAAVILASGIALAQADNRFEFTLSGAGVFSKTVRSKDSAVTVKPTTSGAVFGTFRYHFNHLHAVEANVGHTSNSQIFALPPDAYRITTSITEFSGDYVFTPFARDKWTPFLFAGVGGLKFTVGNTYIDTFQTLLGASNQTALGFLYGGGVDHRLYRVLWLRLQYRGLLYKQPDFGRPNLFFTGARGHLAEPSVGLTVKF
jgi:outer membrane immunogenic protein